MSNMDFSFEDSPLELFVEKLPKGAQVGATALLTLLEGQSEEAVEDAFAAMEELEVELDLSDLTPPVLTGEFASRLSREKALAKEGIRPQGLEETDPLRLYLEELALIPACGDVTLLSLDLARGNGDGLDTESTRTALVNLGLSRVVELAGEYTGWGVLLLDLIQEGSIGLWRATECYYDEGVDFEAYRDRWIRFYMAKAVILQAQASGVGQRMRGALEDYRSVDEQLLVELGRNATTEEIAERLHITPETAETIRKTLENVRLMAQAKKEPEPEEEEIAQTQAVEDTAYFQSRQRVMEMLSALSQEEAKVLSLRFGLDGSLPETPEAVGAKLGMTARQVVDLEAAALGKLRQQ